MQNLILGNLETIPNVAYFSATVEQTQLLSNVPSVTAERGCSSASGVAARSCVRV